MWGGKSPDVKTVDILSSCDGPPAWVGGIGVGDGEVGPFSGHLRWRSTRCFVWLSTVSWA